MNDKEMGIKIDPDAYYTYEEVTILLGIGEKTIRKRVKEGRLTMGPPPARDKCLFKGQCLINFLDGNDIPKRNKNNR